MSNGNITEDLQRESEYTKMLGDRIVERAEPDSDDHFCDEIDRLVEFVGA